MKKITKKIWIPSAIIGSSIVAMSIIAIGVGVTPKQKNYKNDDVLAALKNATQHIENLDKNKEKYWILNTEVINAENYLGELKKIQKNLQNRTLKKTWPGFQKSIENLNLNIVSLENRINKYKPVIEKTEQKIEQAITKAQNLLQGQTESNSNEFKNAKTELKKFVDELQKTQKTEITIPELNSIIEKIDENAKKVSQLKNNNLNSSSTVSNQIEKYSTNISILIQEFITKPKTITNIEEFEQKLKINLADIEIIIKDLKGMTTDSPELIEKLKKLGSLTNKAKIELNKSKYWLTVDKAKQLLNKINRSNPFYEKIHLLIEKGKNLLNNNPDLLQISSAHEELLHALDKVGTDTNNNDNELKNKVDEFQGKVNKLQKFILSISRSEYMQVRQSLANNLTKIISKLKNNNISVQDYNLALKELEILENNATKQILDIAKNQYQDLLSKANSLLTNITDPQLNFFKNVLQSKINLVNNELKSDLNSKTNYEKAYTNLQKLLIQMQNEYKIINSYYELKKELEKIEKQSNHTNKKQKIKLAIDQAQKLIADNSHNISQFLKAYEILENTINNLEKEQDENIPEEIKQAKAEYQNVVEGIDMFFRSINQKHQEIKLNYEHKINNIKETLQKSKLTKEDYDKAKQDLNVILEKMRAENRIKVVQDALENQLVKNGKLREKLLKDSKFMTQADKLDKITKEIITKTSDPTTLSFDQYNDLLNQLSMAYYEAAKHYYENGGTDPSFFQ
ncbi:hypothetical protein MCFN_02505 [Mycoplasmopsis californica]|uniref:Uncharacterized protein n=1 Tax=Mycoplasmopsis californica TaxID=2113 RepID=A0A059XWL7_9BACT|nr:hypothetical protein [Mycoplasmopsis californica]AIA29627.1 hypothetical protein MCFN_02505 [Mycoplasmopsis californica]